MTEGKLVTFELSNTMYHMIRSKRATVLRRLAHRIRIALSRHKPWHVPLNDIVVGEYK